MTDDAKTASKAAAIFDECYRLILEIYEDVRGFPKSQKFVLGQRIETTSVSVLAGLIEANHVRDRAPPLRAASVEVEKLRVFVRLAKDLRFLDFKRYERLSGRIDTIGRMRGGGIKWAEARR
ncbi:MAG: diversity-generating retroelement protein Avd [Myxococcota bacterium]